MARIPTEGYPLVTFPNNVPYYELVQGYAETIAPGEARRHTRVCLVTKENRLAFLRDVLGQAFPTVRITPPAAAAPAIGRNLPDAVRGVGPMYADSAEFLFGLKPFQNTRRARGALEWDEYVYAIQYRELNFDMLADSDPSYRAAAVPELLRYVRRESEDSAEAIGVSGGRFMFVGTTTRINEPPAKALATSELRLTFLHWPTILVPVSAIRNILGKVNAAAFDTEVDRSRWPFANHPAGTLLATGALYKHYYDALGNWLTDWTLKLVVRNNGDAGGGVYAGWNHIWRYSTGAWTLVTHDGTVGGRTIYQTANYNLAVTPTVQS